MSYEEYFEKYPTPELQYENANGKESGVAKKSR
jgi:hypothetical protein